MKVRREHHCTKNHRTGFAMARCVWGTRADIKGRGQYAVVHWLKIGWSSSYPDVYLFDDEVRARAKLRQMSDPFYCGGSCRNAGARHELIRFELGAK
ncbi:hypothetical protein SAMN05421854_10434 [Amycolatopsis rubida]|uniref:Uncharacterized protein n=1 Tax=Amycolatopsis rubida TaxID=112413 RepID=A0A1I5MG57_9PSEU|nr:hypothetical protein SAMN05421854_10434 [Amycolatopsis rubida]